MTRFPASPAKTGAVRAASTSASTTSLGVAATPSARSDVTDRSAMPHGTMWENIARSASTFSAKPCIVRPRDTRTPTAQILRGEAPAGVDPHPGRTLHPSGPRQAEVTERRDDELLQPVHVGGNRPGAHLERDDRVADDLTRPVVGDLAAPVGAHELGPNTSRIGQHVLGPAAHAHRVHGGVL